MIRLTSAADRGRGRFGSPRRVLLLAAFMVLMLGLVPATAESQETAYDPTKDWSVEPGFAIAVDSKGYTLPTAIAVVPFPGEGAKDPLYFVTELQGTVKAVTNDRSVYTFAEDFFELDPKAKLPATAGEVGLAGICLDSDRGYVFVTFAYDDGEVLRNNVVRFETEPRTFSIKPSGQLTFTPVFANDESAPSHQIGPCQVDGEYLFVSVGDGEKLVFSQVVDSTLGKILRMTVDGQPIPDNPFYSDGDPAKTSNYVWATGFRNPFGLKTVDGRVFVADNGPTLDRFLEAHAGTNYLWDGSDWSIGSNADLVLLPSIGVVQLDRYPTGASPFPEKYSQSFFLTRSGNLPWTTAPGKRQPPNILAIEYSLESGKILTTPQQFLRYQAEGDQMLVGLGFGSDALYFVPLNPDESGISSIYKVTYQGGENGPLTRSAREIMGQKGCFACHSLAGTGGTVAPPLDREGLVSRIKTRLNSPEYLQNVKDVDQIDREPFTSFRQARNEVLSFQGLEQVRTWIKYRIQEPRFDNANSVMPNLTVSPQEATLIASFLVAPVETPGWINGWINRISNLIPRPRKRHLVYFFGGGFVLGAAALASSWIALRSLSGRRSANGAD